MGRLSPMGGLDTIDGAAGSSWVEVSHSWASIETI
jgi:hypothetical protein